MTFAALLRRATILACSLFATVAVAQQVQYSHGDPSPLEQQMLELINRARINPTQEGVILDSVNTWYSVAARAQSPSFFTNLRAQFASYPAVAPLAFNPTLIQEARAHSLDMIANHYFAHTDLAGRDPSARGAALGYSGGVGENIDGAGATTADDIAEAHFDFMVDYNNIDVSSPLGHRLNILNSSYSEIGVGVAGGRVGGMITQDFGGPAKAYILGVAYTDANNNATYEPGEELAGITVKPDIGNWYAVTSTSGGFAIPIDPVDTVTDTVRVPFPVQSAAWSTVLPYDTAYRQQQLAAAPNMTVTLTWSGGALTAPKTTTVTIKRPVLRNYKITGTDGWFYTMSMVTTQNAKADITPSSGSITPPKPSAPLRDFNGDGKGDLIFQNTAGQIATWYMNGNGGSSGSAMLYGNGLGDWRVKAIADLNGDGKADIVLQNNAGQIVTWYTNGSGGFTGSAWIYSGGLGDWRVVAAADLNGDGTADIVFQNTIGQIAVWYSGLPSKAAFIYSGGLGDWKVAAVVDMNGDGNVDIVLQNNAGQIVTWYMNGNGSATGSSWIYNGNLGDWKISAVADVNGDGNADLILQNTIGQTVVWYMNGRGSVSGSAWIYSNGLADWRVR